MGVRCTYIQFDIVRANDRLLSSNHAAGEIGSSHGTTLPPRSNQISSLPFPSIQSGRESCVWAARSNLEPVGGDSQRSLDWLRSGGGVLSIGISLLSVVGKRIPLIPNTHEMEKSPYQLRPTRDSRKHLRLLRF